MIKWIFASDDVNINSIARCRYFHIILRNILILSKMLLNENWLRISNIVLISKIIIIMLNFIIDLSSIALLSSFSSALQTRSEKKNICRETEIKKNDDVILSYENLKALWSW